MESERLTRKKRIDPQLQSLGWRIVPFTDGCSLAEFNNCAIEEFPTKKGPADYALCLDGRIIGVVEAKKITLGPQNVLTQAQRYARGLSNSLLNYDGHRAPFLYSTNGEVIWFHDVRHGVNRSRKIAKFHTPDALRHFFERDFEAGLEWLAARLNNHPRLRPYQIDANQAVEKASQTENERCLLPWPPAPAKPSRS